MVGTDVPVRELLKTIPKYKVIQHLRHLVARSPGTQVTPQSVRVMERTERRDPSLSQHTLLFLGAAVTCRQTCSVSARIPRLLRAAGVAQQEKAEKRRECFFLSKKHLVKMSHWLLGFSQKLEFFLFP